MPSMEEYVEADGAWLWIARSGSGLPVLLCHGGPGQWDYLEPVAGLIEDLVTVHRYDQRGCGRSTRGGPHSVARYLDDIEALREHFGHESWVIGGHSWGATLALAYAWTHPARVSALLYISGVGLGTAWRQAYREEGWRRLTPAQQERYLVLRGMTDRSEDEELEYLSLGTSRDYADRATALEKARQHYAVGFAVNYESNRTINAEMSGWREEDGLARCRSLDVPVLVIHGAADPRPSWGGDSLCEALPDVRRVVIEGAGHVPWVERPDSVGDALRSFLGERVLS